MNAFLSDLWYDLREKRLWPVAILLAAALVAVPVLLAKPAPHDSAPDSEPTPSAAKTRADALVALADDTQQDSTLELFDPRNPFRPKRVRSLQSLSSAGISAASNAAVAQQPNSSSIGGGSLGPLSGGTSLGTSGGTSGGTGGGSTGGSGGGTSGGQGGTKTADYTYVVDVTFTHNGHTRQVSGLRKFDMLPSESSPVLIFLGADASGDNAVFLVNSTLSARGEGTCSPSDDACGVLRIGAGSVEQFTSGDGDSYKLQIDQVRKVKLQASSSSTARAGDAGEGRDAPTAHTSGSPSRRFAPPILVDLLAVASAADKRPVISRVSPMRLAVGSKFTVRGKNFSSRVRRNTVLFRTSNGRAAFVKPRRAGRHKLVLVLPPAVGRLLATGSGGAEAARLKLRVIVSRRPSRWTRKRLSPVVVPD